MKNYLYLCIAKIILLCALTHKGYSQSFEPIFEDAEGKTSIIAPRGFFGVNTASSSIRFQYFYSRSASRDRNDPKKIGKWNRFYWGVNVTGAATGGLANLFSEGNFNPGTSADLFLGHRSLFFGTLDRSDLTGETFKNYSKNLNDTITIQDWLTLRSGIQAAKYKLYDSSKPFNQQITSELFRGYLAQLAYTLLINGATSIGISWDISKINNVEDLTPVKFKQQTSITDSSNQTTRTFDQEVNAYTGNYDTSIVNTYSLDVVHLLTSNSNDARYAFHLYGRILKSNERPTYRTGLGFYAFPKGKLFGGVFVESNDLTNEIAESPNFLKRVNIGITVKYVLPTLGDLGE